MKRSFVFVVAVLLAAGCFGEIKYVFYMIGDGMGPNQVLAAEMYRAEMEGRIGRVPLTMTSFPYFGTATTYSASNGITDSAAAGTALATGNKTNNGYLGVGADSLPVISIAEQYHKAGWPVGIMTSVAIDHATPGAFYAHVIKRSNYYVIGTQLAESGYDFFGGAGFHIPDEGNVYPKGPNLYDYCEEHGYTFAHGYADAQTKLEAEKLILVQEEDGIDRTEKAESIPYAIDREEGDLTLPQITETAIKYLEPRGRFFMMIEGGKIDYAGHSRDGATDIKEVLDFDEAIGVVYQFYLAHPDETLIVVTADHETGGMALGNGKYILDLQVLQHQKCSSWEINEAIKDLYDEFGKKLQWEQVKKLLEEKLGFYDQIAITEKEEAKLVTAFKHLQKGKGKTEKTLYNDISELGGAAVNLLNKKAKLGWTSYSHTAANVPVFAIGVGAENFTGWYDNTEIMKKIMSAVEASK
ncbi:MAG: alkaline phosphatase [Paludibacteraceae bacterium]|nr:alkaline phosphatase [Paludibacteraceae bacterium]